MARTYSSKDITLIVGGTIIRGFESISISTNARWDFDFDNEGKDSRFEQANSKFAEVTVNMKQTSPDQQFLTGYYTAGGQIEVLIRDANGLDAFVAAEMSIELPDTIDFAKDAITDRAWVLKGNWQICNIGGAS